MTPITESDIHAAQSTWAEGILAIRRAFVDGADYTTAAREFIASHYAYDLGPVLFKPTLASVAQFRLDAESALSYFVGGNEKYTEDRGFAILPWTAIRFAPAGFLCTGTYAVSMGNYHLANESGEELKVEFTLGYIRDDAGNLRIVLHHSSIPYTPMAGQ